MIARHGQRRWRAALVVAASSWVVGCAVTSPILIEPRATANQPRIAAGGAALVPIAGDVRALADAKAAPIASASSDRGLGMLFAARPGVAPFARATIPFSSSFEGSVETGGRWIGVGGRVLIIDARTETGGATTFAIGARVHTTYDATASDALPGKVARDPRGAGGVVPITLAWQSDAGLVLAYAGLTIGFDALQADATGTVVATESASFSRVFGAATVGLGAGFRRVHGIFELGIERDWIFGNVGGRSASLELWSLTPAFALSFRF